MLKFLDTIPTSNPNEEPQVVVTIVLVSVSQSPLVEFELFFNSSTESVLCQPISHIADISSLYVLGVSDCEITT